MSSPMSVLLFCRQPAGAAVMSFLAAVSPVPADLFEIVPRAVVERVRKLVGLRRLRPVDGGGPGPQIAGNPLPDRVGVTPPRIAQLLDLLLVLVYGVEVLVDLLQHRLPLAPHLRDVGSMPPIDRPLDLPQL